MFARKAPENDNDNYDVYTILPDGTDLRRLTTSLANDAHAVSTVEQLRPNLLKDVRLLRRNLNQNTRHWYTTFLGNQCSSEYFSVACSDDGCYDLAVTASLTQAPSANANRSANILA